MMNTVSRISAWPALWLCAVLYLSDPAAVQAGADQAADNDTGNNTETDAAPAAAEATVAALHDALLQIMRQADALGYAGRAAIMRPIIAQHFDTARIAQVVLGRHWAQLDGSQREEFIALFQQLTTATYASRFAGYNGESFRLNDAEPARRGRIRARAELLRPADATVRLDYLLQDTNRQWRIINVIANGVSDLSLKRAEYAAVIKEKGYNALRDAIKAKIKALQDDG